MPALCISMHAPVALGNAMWCVLELQCCGLLRAISVQAWTFARAARHSPSSARIVTADVIHPEGICWSGQVQRDVFSRWLKSNKD